MEYDLIVIGAGHAGCEAALIASKMGIKTLIITINLDGIAALSCNPNIGGTGKGHLVKEVDALGGMMGLISDKTYLQSRILNRSKGPAVHSLRVQMDKRKYHEEMKKTLENQKNLELRQMEATDLLIEDGEIKGIQIRDGRNIFAKAVVVATGTYLGGKVFIGENIYSSGPDGRFPSNILSENMKKRGITLRRLKTGTPPRIHRDSIDFSVMEEQLGDEVVTPFSFMNTPESIKKEQVPCYLTHTTTEMHDFILENMEKSALYSGKIEGTGPRYCPSIEDKIKRFTDKKDHQVFIEPEGITTKEMYLQGVSTSMPEHIQEEMIKMITGLENAKIMRPGYAIEYDAIFATDLKSTLESKTIKNLFFAGQINGSSGYEEAACQGLVAGINASLNILGREEFVLNRDESYIGVLIDDLVSKISYEPYRMMTARAEHRLKLRQDNADVRLTEKGYKAGSVSEERLTKLKEKLAILDEIRKELMETKITPSRETNEKVEKYTKPLKTAISLYDFLKRPEINFEILEGLFPIKTKLTEELKMYIETETKYSGYIEKSEDRLKKMKKMEETTLPYDFDYTKVKGLKKEAEAKLMQVKPENLRQAGNISGVNPADIWALMIHLEMEKRK